MWLRRCVRAVTIAGVVSVVAWACSSSGGGPRDMYGLDSDVGAGYAGPEVGSDSTTGDAGGGETD